MAGAKGGSCWSGEKAGGKTERSQGAWSDRAIYGSDMIDSQRIRGTSVMEPHTPPDLVQSTICSQTVSAQFLHGSWTIIR